MGRLATSALLILAFVGLTATATPPGETTLAHAKIRCGPPDVPSQAAQQSNPEGNSTPSAEPQSDEGKAQPPGRQDPNEFYKKAPRKPRQLRHIYA